MLYDNSDVTLFEVSWEVCNKVGGIYSVISSKMLEAVEKFGDNYFLLGPDLGNNAEFIESDEACWAPIKTALGVRNIKCRFGRWDIPGKPKVILVSFSGWYNKDQLLAELWNRYGVDSLSGGWDYVEPVLFSSLCGEIIATVFQTVVQPGRGRALAHFHEWMCGAGLLNVKKLAPEIGTVFTTHATMLGRSMAGADVNIYRQMRQISPSQEAAAHNISAKCSMESASAREADCFTTVSGITATEATVFLGRAPDVLTLNGIDLRVIPDYSKDRAGSLAFRVRLLQAANKLLRKKLPEDTRIFIISGRYEFHNKGIDAFLDALASAEQAIQQTNTQVLAVCAVMGGHMGVNQNAVSGDPNIPSDQGSGWISSHHVHDLPHDPIINTCNRLGLVNGPGNNVNVIFVPCLLDGNDGFLNMDYYELLAACDLGVFPSWYEPWGYTPQESAAFAVPTVTTDLSGFGLWARELQEQRSGKSGVTVIPRHQSSYDSVVTDLRNTLLEYATCPAEILDARRKAVRHLSKSCTWEQFFPFYIKAYTLALDKTVERGVRPAQERRTESLNRRMLTAAPTTTPHLHMITAVAELPRTISRLRELANNFWWCWHPSAWKLFEPINPVLWKRSDHNPIQVIEEADPNTLRALTQDVEYMALYKQVLDDFDTYMSKKPSGFGPEINAKRPVAYFSTEYGLHESLTIYSGGLGVLSGDHLKAASDLNVPLVGVGLLYKNGYFRQYIDTSGRQVPLYPENNFDLLAVERVLDSRGIPLMVDIDLPGRKLYAHIWLVRVGRVKLYLMDSDTPQNTPEDRKVTARLYEADRDIRIRQEILLGMGGVRMLRRLGIWPTVYHMNEGHSAFMALERIQRYMIEDGLSLNEAKEIVRSNTVFTTHTPVEAGNERFSTELIEQYFSGYAASIGLSFNDFLRFGRFEGDSRHVFEMTILALNMSIKANGVSLVHGLVSRKMWRDLWKGVPVAEVPIGHVTNGIHVPSYVGPAMRPLLDEYLGSNWLHLSPNDPAWDKVRTIPDGKLLLARSAQKARLYEEIRTQLPAFFQKFEIPRADQAAYLNAVAVDKLDTLVICFARRFAPYKRANLLFANLDRLERILTNSSKPVILVFSGKAHPADEEGIKLIQAVLEHCRSPRFKGRVFFLEDYSLRVSRLMVQGCDVWLNNPRRPYEASGTSGEKVPVNGGLNLSISDGWWSEGQGEKNGWTIGPVVTDTLPKDDQNDYADAESLYALLEDEVVPLFYERNPAGMPEKWLEYSKRSIQTLTAQFSTARMVSDYIDKLYRPAAEYYAVLNKDDRAHMKRLAAWKHEVPSRFATVKLENIDIDGMDGDILVCGTPFTVSAAIQTGSMQPEEMLVQLVIGPTDGEDFITNPDIVKLEPTQEKDGLYSYKGTYVALRNGRYAYGVRIMPTTDQLMSVFSTRLVLWG